MEASRRLVIPWTICARSPNLDPLEHLWDILGRKFREISPPVQTLLELDRGCIVSEMAANPSAADTTPGPGRRLYATLMLNLFHVYILSLENDERNL